MLGCLHLPCHLTGTTEVDHDGCEHGMDTSSCSSSASSEVQTHIPCSSALAHPPAILASPYTFPQFCNVQSIHMNKLTGKQSNAMHLLQLVNRPPIFRVAKAIPFSVRHPALSSQTSALVFKSIHSRRAGRKSVTSMAIGSGMNSLSTSTGARLAYTILYGPDVSKSVEFYQKAFGLTLRFMDASKK